MNICSRCRQTWIYLLQQLFRLHKMYGWRGILLNKFICICILHDKTSFNVFTLTRMMHITRVRSIPKIIVYKSITLTSSIVRLHHFQFPIIKIFLFIYYLSLSIFKLNKLSALWIYFVIVSMARSLAFSNSHTHNTTIFQMTNPHCL